MYQKTKIMVWTQKTWSLDKKLNVYKIKASMDYYIKQVGFQVENVIGYFSIFPTIFFALLIANLLICFARWGCKTQEKQINADQLAVETCAATISFQNFYRSIRDILQYSSILFIYASMFWNLGKTIKSPSGIANLLIPYILYNVFVYVLEIFWPLLLDNKISTVQPNFVVYRSNPLDFCPSSGTVGTGNGNVGCKRSTLMSITDSLVQSFRTFLPQTTIGASLDNFSFIVLYALLIAVSAYIHM